MQKLKIPKFENETDEANWMYEHREELATAFMNQYRQDGGKQSPRLEGALIEALQTKELVVVSES